MARYIATEKIVHDGVTIMPGDTITGMDPLLVEHWVDSGAVETMENIEPSLRDEQSVWAEFLVEQELLSEDEAAGMSKEALVDMFMHGDDDEPPAPDGVEEDESDPETSDETPEGDDPEDDGSDDTTEPDDALAAVVNEPSGGEEE